MQPKSAEQPEKGIKGWAYYLRSMPHQPNTVLSWKFYWWLVSTIHTLPQFVFLLMLKSSSPWTHISCICTCNGHIGCLHALSTACPISCEAGGSKGANTSRGWRQLDHTCQPQKEVIQASKWKKVLCCTCLLRPNSSSTNTCPHQTICGASRMPSRVAEEMHTYISPFMP